MARLRQLDVEAAAGLIAAITALVLHLLHIADADVLLAIVLVILALILVRDLRRETREERQTEALEHSLAAIREVRAAVTLPDTVLIGPGRLRSESAAFAGRARGDMVWFNVCLLMFEPQSLFDTLLRPAIENPRVTSILFILDEGERGRWRDSVMPKVAACRGAEKVLEPHWGRVRESVSTILAETDAGDVEGLLSFWGEPFMARTPGREVPRYIFHVQRHSELIGRLRELERAYRLPAR